MARHTAGSRSLDFVRVIGEFDLWKKLGYRTSHFGFVGYCPRCSLGRVRISDKTRRFRCRRCRASGDVIQFLALVRRINLTSAQILSEQLSRKGENIPQSIRLRTSGLVVLFRSQSSASVFDCVVDICSDLGIPLYVGYGIVFNIWVKQHLQALTTNEDVITPTREQIECWIRGT